MNWRFIMGGSLLAVLGVRTAAAAGVRVVETPSVPVGFYLARAPRSSASAVTRGAYVCLPVEGPHVPAALREAVRSGRVPARWKVAPLFKRVVGLEGDVVTDAPGGGVRINGARVPDSTAERFDANGQPLPHPSLPRVLGPGEVWLASEHARGFDSRYFGPVNVAALSCVGEPLWTW